MAKNANTARSQSFRVTVSAESYDFLDQIARRGIYGRNPAEVASRFIDEKLQEFVTRPKLRSKSLKQSR